MEIILEFLLQIFLELFGQLIFEFVAEACVRIFGRDSLVRSRHPALAASGYVLLAALGSCVSLLLFPSHVIRSEGLRMVNLLVAPVLAGGIMALWGGLLRSRGKKIIRLDSFGYGFLFALTFAVIRYFFAG